MAFHVPLEESRDCNIRRKNITRGETQDILYTKSAPLHRNIPFARARLPMASFIRFRVSVSTETHFSGGERKGEDPGGDTRARRAFLPTRVFLYLPRHGGIAIVIETGDSRINRHAEVDRSTAAESMPLALSSLEEFMGVELQQLQVPQQQGGHGDLLGARNLCELAKVSDISNVSHDPPVPLSLSLSLSLPDSRTKSTRDFIRQRITVVETTSLQHSSLNARAKANCKLPPRTRSKRVFPPSTGQSEVKYRSARRHGHGRRRKRPIISTVVRCGSRKEADSLQAPEQEGRHQRSLQKVPARPSVRVCHQPVRRRVDCCLIVAPAALLCALPRFLRSGIPLCASPRFLQFPPSDSSLGGPAARRLRLCIARFRRGRRRGRRALLTLAVPPRLLVDPQTLLQTLLRHHPEGNHAEHTHAGA